MSPLPFFLNADPGRRFCLLHQAADGIPRRGAIVYLHPFAEEMNKSRRMAALQSRQMSQAGYDVLQIDLYGCGDSDGDFADARWAIWLQDAGLAVEWLRSHQGGPVCFWGLRLGALLALALAVRMAPSRLILWQPVWTGKNCLKQFYRLGIAAQLAQRQDTGAPQPDPDRETEIGGYRLSGALAAELEAVDVSTLALPDCPIDCYWLVPQDAAPPPVLAPRDGLSNHLVHDAPFWGTGDITESPALLRATCADCL